MFYYACLKKSVMISVAHALNSNHICDGIVNTLKPVLMKSIKTTWNEIIDWQYILWRNKYWNMEYTILSWALTNLKFYWLVYESFCLKIKSKLQGITKISDLNKATKYLVKSSDLETRVTSIVNKLLVNFEKTMKKSMRLR